jgi:uncharacterized protein YbaR (Trm112 family)
MPKKTNKKMRYQCKNSECPLDELTSISETLACPTCHEKLSIVVSSKDRNNVRAQQEEDRAWREEIANEAGAMYGYQAYLDHHNVSFGDNECFGCGITISQGTRCEWCS